MEEVISSWRRSSSLAGPGNARADGFQYGIKGRPNLTFVKWQSKGSFV
jgi:hypothetical protein